MTMLAVTLALCKGCSLLLSKYLRQENHLA